MKEKSDAKYYGTYLGSEIVRLSPEEIIHKFGSLIFFSNDEEYKLWCREKIGGDAGIHKPTDPDSLRSL